MDKWKQDLLKLEAKAPEEKKGFKPQIRGAVTEYKGKTKVSLWVTEDFFEIVKRAVKEAIREC